MRGSGIMASAAGAALAVLLWQTHTLTKKVAQQNQQLGAQAAEMRSRDAAIKSLLAASQRAQKNTQALRKKLYRAQQTVRQHTQREAKIYAKLENRDWRAAAVPADIVRLYRRQAFSCASDFAAALPTRGAVPDTSKQPQN